MRRRDRLTAATLKKHLYYDYETGLFYRFTNDGADEKATGYIGAGGYVIISVPGNGRFSAGPLVWLYHTGKWPEFDVDHEDGNRQNNRIGNLRDVTRRVNKENQRKPCKRNKSGFLGVHWHKGNGSFCAQIRVKGKLQTLGYFADPEVAHKAYLDAKRKQHEGCTI